MNSRLVTQFLAAIALGACASVASAQHKHAHPLKSQHGGEVVEGKRHHFELVLLPSAGDAAVLEISLYVTNHSNKPVKVDAAEGAALLRSGGRQARAVLATSGKDYLRGSASFAPAADLEVDVTVSIGKLPAEKFTFRPLRPQR
jgi:hypothetical protein